MPAKTPQELFVALLSNLRKGTEIATKFYQRTKVAHDPQVKQALEGEVRGGLRGYPR